MNDPDKQDGRPALGPKAPSEADLADRLRGIDARLSDIRSERAPPPPSSGSLQADGTAMGRGMKLVSEFVGGIVAGGLLGWIIDRLAGTQPFVLLIGLMFGFAAGLRNLYRATQAGSGPKAGG